MRRLAVVLTVAVFLGCQQSPTPGPAPAGSLTVRLKAEGDGLAARGDYEGAALKYQQAANQEPEDVSIRFALGSALSHLNRREETVDQFRFVVSRGKPDSPEVQAARRWLIAAGELAGAVTFSGTQETMPAIAATPSTPQSPVAGGKVKGRTGARPGTQRVSILLTDRVRTMSLEKTAMLGEPFEFESVPPGTYELTVEDAENGSQLWDVEVTVTAGKETVLDLK